jgi:hypothetical protein
MVRLQSYENYRYIHIHKNNMFLRSNLKNVYIVIKLLTKYRTYILLLELFYKATVLGKKLRQYLSVRHFINVKVFEFLSWYSLELPWSGEHILTVVLPFVFFQSGCSRLSSTLEHTSCIKACRSTPPVK